nr:nucleolin [Hymenolepis microstoma]
MSSNQSKDSKLHHRKKSLKHKNKLKKISVEAVEEFFENTIKAPKSKKNQRSEDYCPKSNDHLRGSTTCFLIRGLPLNVKIQKLKKDLCVTPKAINLSKKDGQRSALVTFKSIGDCCEAFDALKGYSYESHSATVAFVRPRSVIDKENIPTPTCFDFLLDITNIPFYLTLEDLKNMFPKAETIIQRCRHDRTFKGSCILSFTSKEDFDEAMNICKESPVEGRELACTPTTSEICKALLEELASRSNTPTGNKEGTQLKLFNLPYSITKEELKKSFPQARHIFLPTSKGGEPTGIAILTFKTAFICKAALEKAKKTEIQGRKLRAEINSLKPNDKKKKKSSQSKGNGNKFSKDKSVKYRRMKPKIGKSEGGEVKLNLD